MTKVTGELISIDDSAYDGLKSLTVYGNTRQNLWVNPSGTQNGVTVTANADGSVTVSGTSSVGSRIFFGNGERRYILKPSTKYMISVNEKVGDASPTQPTGGGFIIQYNKNSQAISQNAVGYGTTLQSSFTTPSEFDYVEFMLVIPPNATVSGTYRVMLNEGSTAEPWCPPGLNSVGDGGSVEVVTAGKNLWSTPNSDTSNGITFTANDDGSFTLGGSLTAASPSGTYFGSITLVAPPIGSKVTLSVDSALSKNYVRILLQFIGDTAEGKEVIGGNNYIGFSNTLSKTMTVPEHADYIGMGVYVISSAPAGTAAPGTYYPQLELGSTATSYEPPNITTTSIDLQGHTLNALPDGTRDELHIDGGGNVVLEKRTQKVQLDGDANWSRYDTPYVHYTSPWTNFNGLPSGYIGANYYVDKLPASNSVPNGLYSANTNGNTVYVREPAFASDAAGVKTWMGANTPTIIMPLLEPQTIDLGTIDLPKLRKKPLVNNIWANGTADGTGFSPAPEIDCEYNRWSTYCDGFKTHGKHSYFDMGCCVAARDTGTPEKKSVTATVPYMSGFYDLSKLYGAIAFEARQLMYRFEFVEDSREELQQKKSQFLEWLSQVHDEEIADDDIPGRHFIGSLSEWEFEEGEEGQSGSLEVTFNCQPFLEADEDTTKTCNVGSNTVTVEGQAVNAYAKTNSGTATIQIGGVTQSVGTTEIRLSVQLQPGDNAVTVTGSPVVLRWKELTV